MNLSSGSVAGPDQARQVSVLVHRADGSSEEQGGPLASPPSTSQSGRGARALRSFLGRLWRGTEHVSGTTPRRLELSFSAPPSNFPPQLGRREDQEPDDLGSEQGDGDAQSLVESAERHRLTTSIGLDLEGVSLFLEVNAPYVGVMLFLFLCSHLLLLIAFTGLTFALRRLNRIARDSIAGRHNRDGRGIRRLLGASAAGALAAFPTLILLVHPRSIDIAMHGFWSCVILIMALDTGYRVLIASTKLGLVALFRSESPKIRRRQAAALTFIEHGGAFLRGAAPVMLWIRYLRGGPSGIAILSSYLLLKCLELRTRGRAALAAGRQLLHSDHGSIPSAEEIAEAGSLCPICQEAPTVPTKLSCGHIFCDACVSEWFERERSCPMCRAAMGPAGVKSFSDGRTPLTPILF